MNVEEFVSQTLVQIKRGVRAANKVLVDEESDPSKRAAYFLLPIAVSKEYIEFDLAVTVGLSGSASAGAAGGLNVWGLKVAEGHADGKVEGSREEVSRVRFSVSVMR